MPIPAHAQVLSLIDGETYLPDLTHLSFQFDEERRVLWTQLKGNAPTRLTPSLLTELSAVRRLLERWKHPLEAPMPLFHVFSSTIPGVFGLGGDVWTFASLIRAGNRADLDAYARQCVDLVYSTANGYRAGICTIALVQGAAFGGGFEAALASHLIVAEHSSVFGFPELLFNLFPGMGALGLLRRRVSHSLALKIIESARTYRASELLELGVIDVLVPDGEGTAAVDTIIRSKSRRPLGHQALMKACGYGSRPSLEELHRTATLWVDTAMALSGSDLRTMERIAAAQQRRDTTKHLSLVP